MIAGETPRGARAIATPPAGHHREDLIRGILITAACLLIARSCGLLREFLVAARFGPTGATDAIYVAVMFVTTAMTVLSSALPNAVAQVFYTGAIAPGERDRLVWTCLVWWSVVLGVLALAIVVFPEALLRVLASPESPEFEAEAVTALRLTAPILFLQGMFLPLAAVGNASGWHTPVALLSTGFPLGGVLGVLVLHRGYGPSSLLLGIIATSAMQVGLLVGCLWRRGMAPSWTSPARVWPTIRRLIGVAAPIVAGIALWKLDGPMLVRFATDLEPGDVFLLSVALMVANVPMSIALQSLTQTTIPDLVRSAAAGDTARFARVGLRSSELALLMIVPFAALMIVDAPGVVALLFRRGRFGVEAVARTASVLRVFSGASWFLILAAYLEDVLTSRGQALRVASGRGAAIVAMAIACGTGARLGGLVGLVWGYALANAFRYAAVAFLVVRGCGISGRSLGAIHAKVGASGLLAGLAAHGVRSALPTSAGPIVRLAAEATAIAAVMLVACHLLDVESVREGIARLGRVRDHWADRASRRRLAVGALSDPEEP